MTQRSKPIEAGRLRFEELILTEQNVGRKTVIFPENGLC